MGASAKLPQAPLRNLRRNAGLTEGSLALSSQDNQARELVLYRPKAEPGVRYVVLVDEEDYERVVGAGPWRLLKGRATFYALREARDTSGTKQIALLHRFILADHLTPDLQVDHVSGDGLDCRRANMRVVTNAQNRQNVRKCRGTSKYRGVHWNTRRERWVAKVVVCGTEKYLGLFVSEERAGRVAANARRRLLPWSNEARHPVPGPAA